MIINDSMKLNENHKFTISKGLYDESDKAFLFLIRRNDTNVKVDEKWFPKSQMIYNKHSNGDLDVDINDWIWSKNVDPGFTIKEY